MNMRYMFPYGPQFNQPLGAWNVTRVTNMGFMFQYANRFNQTLGTWDVTRVTNMEYMFEFATQFNQPLETQSEHEVHVSIRGPVQPAWDVSKVTNMYGMFREAKQFNQGKFCGASWVSSTASKYTMFNGVVQGSISGHGRCNCTCANGTAATGPECYGQCDYLCGGRGDDSGSTTTHAPTTTTTEAPVTTPTTTQHANNDSGSNYNSSSYNHNISADNNSGASDNNVSANDNNVSANDNNVSANDNSGARRTVVERYPALWQSTKMSFDNNEISRGGDYYNIKLITFFAFLGSTRLRRKTGLFCVKF